MPYLVMFGIILAVLSFCAFSRQTDGASLVNSLARSTASTASTPSMSASEKAAARAARAGPRPARTRPPELSPQAQSGQSSEQSQLISLCPQLVVPEKVECTLLVPLVGSGLAKRASTLQVSDVKGETIFLLETVPDGRSSDGTRLILSSPAKDVRLLEAVQTGRAYDSSQKAFPALASDPRCKVLYVPHSRNGFRLGKRQGHAMPGVYGGRLANLKKLDSGFTLTAHGFQGSLSTSIDATDDDGKVLAYSGVAEADRSGTSDCTKCAYFLLHFTTLHEEGIPKLKLSVGPGADAGLMVVCYAALELLYGASH